MNELERNQMNIQYNWDASDTESSGRIVEGIVQGKGGE